MPTKITFDYNEFRNDYYALATNSRNFDHLLWCNFRAVLGANNQLFQTEAQKYLISITIPDYISKTPIYIECNLGKSIPEESKKFIRPIKLLLQQKLQETGYLVDYRKGEPVLTVSPSKGMGHVDPEKSRKLNDDLVQAREAAIKTENELLNRQRLEYVRNLQQDSDEKQEHNFTVSRVPSSAALICNSKLRYISLSAHATVISLTTIGVGLVAFGLCDTAVVPAALCATFASTLAFDVTRNYMPAIISNPINNVLAFADRTLHQQLGL